MTSNNEVKCRLEKHIVFSMVGLYHYRVILGAIEGATCMHFGAETDM